MESPAQQFFDYARTSREEVVCNLCKKSDKEVVSLKDRYGLPVTTVICRNCGFIFISPRISSADYDRFYTLDEYRTLVKKYRNRHKKQEDSSQTKLDFDKLFLTSIKFGNEIIEHLSSYINRNQGLTIEIGSSCGGVLNAFKLAGLDVLGIEPSPTEAGYATSKGIKTHISMFESLDFSALRLSPIQNILTVRSLNHFLDPGGFVNWSHRQLAVGGKLIMVVADFIGFCRRRGILRTQIDHPYMFTKRTLVAFVKSAGFKLEYCVVEKDFIYLVAKKEGMVQPQHPVVDNVAYRESKRSLSHWNLLGHYWLRKIKSKFVQ